jgi:hypothetical protein
VSEKTGKAKMFAMRINPLSALLGAVSLAVVLLTVSALHAPSTTSPAQHLLTSLGVTIDKPVDVNGIPSSGYLVRIPESVPYLVPPHRTLILTGVVCGDLTSYDEGCTAYPLSGLTIEVPYWVTVDGLPFVVGNLNSNSDTSVFFWGMRIPPRATVIIEDPYDSCIGGSVSKVASVALLGYLADA